MPRRLVLILTALGLTLALAAAPASAGQPLVKTDSPDPVAPGGSLTYTITLTNGGGSEEPFAVSDFLPAEVAFVTATPSTGTATYLSGPHVVTWDGSIAASTSAVLTLIVTVDPAAPDTVITNEIQGLLGDSVVFTQTNTNIVSPQSVAQSVAASVAASLADAATIPPSPATPLATLGIGLLLLASLATLAFANVRRR